jgi:hypothetical protein
LYEYTKREYKNQGNYRAIRLKCADCKINGIIIKNEHRTGDVKEGVLETQRRRKTTEN